MDDLMTITVDNYGGQQIVFTMPQSTRIEMFTELNEVTNNCHLEIRAEGQITTEINDME